jgi:hypothetical protein
MRQTRKASKYYFCINISEGEFFTADFVLNGIPSRKLHGILWFDVSPSRLWRGILFDVAGCRI